MKRPGERIKVFVINPLDIGAYKGQTCLIDSVLQQRRTRRDNPIPRFVSVCYPLQQVQSNTFFYHDPSRNRDIGICVFPVHVRLLKRELAWDLDPLTYEPLIVVVVARARAVCIGYHEADDDA